MVDPAYWERPPHPALRRAVRCVWSGRVGDPADPGARVLPDGCADLLFAPGLAPWIAGPDTAPESDRPRPGTRVIGIRFGPGAAGAVLGTSMEGLRDARPALGDVWPRGRACKVAEALARAWDTGGTQAVATVQRALEAAVASRLEEGPAPEPSVTGAVAALDAAIARGVVARLRPPRGGPGERQLRRRFVAAVGYGPRTYARVMRFQRFLHRAEEGGLAGRSPPGLAGLAAACGYADQAHLTRECSGLAGLSPAALLRARASGRFKTGRVADASFVP